MANAPTTRMVGNWRNYDAYENIFANMLKKNYDDNPLNKKNKFTRMLPTQHEMVMALGLPGIYPNGIGDPDNSFRTIGEIHEQTHACKRLVAKKRAHYFNRSHSPCDAFSHDEYLANTRYQYANSFKDLRAMC
eukprot:2109455-Lingulodinium_polyedra.AAC.1